MKEHKILTAAVLLAASIGAVTASAVTLDDIQFWTGSGTNRAALVIQWSTPEVRNSTTVPNPTANKTLVWGYRWDGIATAEAMFNAIVKADRRLFVATSPTSVYGPFIYAIGYDLNNNGVFGVRVGTNVLAENVFTNGQYVFTTELSDDSDSAQSLDAGDLFWSGLDGANWEMWQEQGGQGGFFSAPECGSNRYWTPTDTLYFSSGSHGQWDYSSSLGLVTLHDGSWIGFTISAGGLNYLDEADPGTIAYDYHKHAPSAMEPASTGTSYAVQLIASQGPFGSMPYDDPNCVLGAPATRFYESKTKPSTRVKLVEPAYNYTVVDGVTNKLIVTLNTGSALIAKFDHPVYDNPVNPYGIDFEVFGNAFYAGNGFSSDAANMNTLKLTSGGFYEPTKISVSPGYTGQPGEDPADPGTWPWYRYDDGPYGDKDCPTQAYKWDRKAARWTDELLDFTKPVNPMLKSKLNASGSTLSAADAIDLYNGSGGGTGFDLKPSGFSWIQYIKAEGIAGYSAGEIDAFSIVRPMTIGDSLSITPANITNNTAQVFFQKPGAEDQTVLAINFTQVSTNAQVTTAWLNDGFAMNSIPGSPLIAVQVGIAPILGTDPIVFQGDLIMSTGVSYKGDGSDLRAYQWDGTNWNARVSAYQDGKVTIQGVTNLSAFALSQFVAPQFRLQTTPNGFALQFTPVVNCLQELQRSSDLQNWTTIASVSPTNPTPVLLEDTASHADKAFYRLRVTIP